MKTIWTDGACSGNPGPGGYGVVILDENEEVIDYVQGILFKTTNNEAELSAILEACAHAASQPKESYTICTDSAYCYNALTNWMFNWEREGWIKSDGNPPKNLELFKHLFEYFSKPDHPQLKKVSGHKGIRGNELADALATGNLKKFDNLKNL